MTVKIAVYSSVEKLKQKAISLAKKLHIPFTDSPDDYEFLLALTPTRLELIQVDSPFSPIYIDFLSDALYFRRQRATSRRELIAKAVGIKGRFHPSILDATAGFGKDALILASLGCKVRMTERSPIMGALLKDALARAKLDPSFRILHLKLICIDANIYMQKLIHQYPYKPDVIYLDPMFPSRHKSALVKKEMRIIKNIVGEDKDVPQLFNNALLCARKRIVVKRPRLAPNLIPTPKPDIVFSGKCARFDVYLIKDGRH